MRAKTIGFEKGGDPYKKMGIGQYADPLKHIQQYIQTLFDDKDLTFESSNEWPSSYEIYLGDAHETMLFYNPIEYKQDNIKAGWALESPYDQMGIFELGDLDGLKKALKELHDNSEY